METEADRYQYIQKKSGLSKTDFAASIGLQKAHGSLISSGRQKLSREYLQNLSESHQINLHWYLTGKGSPNINDNAVSIELIDQEAAAGHGVEVDDYPETRALQVPRALIYPYSPGQLKAVYVKGDSMIEEKINDGDIVIFHPSIMEGNGIYVVSVGNSLLVKRVDFNLQAGEITLISANPAYEPRRYTGYDLEDIRVAGRVIAWYHKA